nr:hypothetical protein [Tanacetum cinerariifolium]
MKLEEKKIEEDRAAKAKYWKLFVCYDDDDDDEERSNSLDDNIISGLPLFFAITPDEPVLSTEDPDNSLNQIEDFFESNEEFSSIDDDSFSIDDIDYVEASPLDSELVSSEVMEIVILETKSSSTSLNSLLEETHNFDNSLPEFTTFSKVLFDAEYESDSSDDQLCSDEDVLETIVSKPLCEEDIIPMESLRTHDSSLPILSKIDSLLGEFAGELTLLKSIPSRIDETDCDFEEDIHLIDKLLYGNSSLRPPKEFVSANSDAATEKPPDGDTGILNIKMMGDISDQKAFMHKLMITLAPHQEKSPDLLSHRCGTAVDFFGPQEPESPEAVPLSPDYVPGPEEPEQALLLPDYPFPGADSPIALSLGCITDLDPEDLKNESDDGPTDYPADGGDDDDSSGDDADDKDEGEDEASKEDKDEEEEYLTPTDSAAAASPVMDPTTCHTYSAIITTHATIITTSSDTLTTFPVPSPPTISPTYTEVPLGYRVDGIWLRTASPPPLPLSSPLPLPPPIILLRTRASMVMMRAAAPFTYCLELTSGTPPLLPIPLPTSSPPLLLPSTDCRADVPKVTSTGGSRADNGFVSTLDFEIRRDPDRETDFVTTVRQDTDEIYVRLGNAQDDRSVMSGQLNLLCRDRRFHACTARLMEGKARVTREAWAQAMDASDMARSKMVSLQSQQRAARDPTHLDVPKEADSSS